jgi:hypothetical protein
MACWIWGENPQALPIAGADFTPETTFSLAIAGEPIRSVRSDAAGELTAALDPPAGLDPPQSPLGSPSLWTAPRAISVQVLSDSPSRPQVLASMQVLTVWQGTQLLVPGLGRSQSRPMGSRLELQSGGASAGQTFYLHYAYTGRRHRVAFGTFRLGVASGPCGTLAMRFDMFRRVRPRPGYWNIWSDALPRVPRALERARLIPVFTLFKLSRTRDGAWIERFR